MTGLSIALDGAEDLTAIKPNIDIGAIGDCVDVT
jgi:hypothetical protein